MAVVLRLRRTGRKNLPCFRIIATDSRFPRDGRHLESIGVYDPLRKDDAARIRIDLERAKHWIGKGAKPSDIVASILRKRGLYAVVPAKKRKRPERSRVTKTGARRSRLEAERATRKLARFAERKKAKRVAAKAAAAAGEAKTEEKQ